MLNYRIFRKYRLNKANWLILIFISLTGIFLACSSPRTVRSLNNNYNGTALNEVNDQSKPNELQREDNKTDEEPVTISSIKSTEIPKTVANSTETTKRKIPSLREQMKIYSEEQELIKQKVTILQSDVSVIKNSIDEIKDAVQDIRGDRIQTAIAGEPVETKMSSRNFIESDETVSRRRNVSIPNDNHKVKSKGSPVPVNYEKKIVPVKIKAVKILQTKDQTTNKIEIPKKVKQTEQKKEGYIHKNPESLNNALSFFSKKDYHRAIIELNNVAATEKSPETTVLCNYWLGESHFAINQYDKAVQYFQKVVRTRNSPRQDNAQAMIAESLIRSGQIPEAKKAFRSLIASYPSSQFIPHARKMLQQL